MNVRLNPCTSETITITVPTPMMIPRQVRNERSFCSRIARSAASTFSRRAAKSWSQRLMRAPARPAHSQQPTADSSTTRASRQL